MVIYILWLLCILWINFHGFRRFLMHGNSSYVILYTQCLKYNVCSAWFLDVRISTCSTYYFACKEMATRIKKLFIWMVPLHFKFCWLLSPLILFQWEFNGEQ